MSKIVKAVNAMVSNPSLFSEVMSGMHETEVFFKYDGKHCWSILQNKENEQFYLSYFPNQPDLADLASIPDHEWEGAAPHSINYSTKDIPAKEARDSFQELFSLVNEKLYGMDEVLDEIISSDDVF